MSSNDKMKIVEDIVRSYCKDIQIDWEDMPEAKKEKLVAVWYKHAIIMAEAEERRAMNSEEEKIGEME